MKALTHVDASGAARMVDVSEKPVTRREAVATAAVEMRSETLALLLSGATRKGDALAVARVAGIMAAKGTGELIPLCHPVGLESVTVDFTPEPPGRLRITATALVTARTGIEMEALTAASVAALTIYDMCKAVDREMVITDVRLERKSGGRSGDYRRAPDQPAAPPPPAADASPIQLTVLYFGGLRPLVGGAREDAVALPGPCDVAGLLDELCDRHEGLGRVREQIRIAVNEQFDGPRRVLSDGDVVALIPPVAGGAGALCRLSPEPLELGEVVDAVSAPSQGGIATFVGIVRDHNEGHAVTRLEYEAYDAMVLSTLAAIVAQCEATADGVRVAVTHRVGALQVGDAAVMIAASAPHRAEAFAACRMCIELLKQDVPIFKREVSPAGAEWIGLRP